MKTTMVYTPIKPSGSLQALIVETRVTNDDWKDKLLEIEKKYGK